MNQKEWLKAQNEQYRQNKLLEIELARMQERQAAQELTATETAVNIDYLVCLEDLNG